MGEGGLREGIGGIGRIPSLGSIGIDQRQFPQIGRPPIGPDVYWEHNDAFQLAKERLHAPSSLMKSMLLQLTCNILWLRNRGRKREIRRWRNGGEEEQNGEEFSERGGKWMGSGGSGNGGGRLRLPTGVAGFRGGARTTVNKELAIRVIE
ncbi:hypothetical protein Bca52824_000390 [Brassica carinata]|uniref:Uncharacterized protein n=1 Tax=Brassica carinata TaxID=52824 RepID=A0A8X7WHB1_BRACI|nr:hypothetical protein Bca52824_000390 [Brassica carinata]